jgi:hypothetical protein
MEPARERMGTMPTDNSWPKLILMLVWRTIKVVGMWAGIFFVSGGAMYCAFHLVYGARIPNPRLPHVIILGLALLASCSYAYHSWIGRLTAFRNLLIYALGVILPVLTGIALARSFALKRKPIELLDGVVLFTCAVVYYVAYSFLKARKALLPRT